MADLHADSDRKWRVVYLEVVTPDVAEIIASRLPPSFQLSFIKDYSDEVAISALTEADFALVATHLHPGDDIIGDEDGVVVVARGDVPTVLKELQKVGAKEREMKERIEAGWTLPEWTEEALSMKGVQVIDEGEKD